MNSDPDDSEPIIADAIDDPVPVNVYREAALRYMDHMQNCARIIKEYRGDPVFVCECWWLAMGWLQFLDKDRQTQTGLAAHYKHKNGRPMTKANVNKLVKKFQSFLTLPGERSEISRQRMSQSRKKQCL